MRKKYLSALLFGALLFASAGTFTSCKDYDDDIKNLQEQINTVVSDLNSLKSTVDQLGGYVTDVKIEDGKLLVTVDNNTITYDLPTAAEVDKTTVALDGQNLVVDGEVIGKVGDTVTVNEDGYLCVNGEATEIKAGKYAILENDADGVYTITLPNANGELQTIELAKASSAISLKTKDGNTTFYAAGESATNGINWGIAPKDIDWKGPKGAVAKGDLLVGQINNDVPVTVRPVSYDLGAQKLEFVDSEGNIAKAAVVATPAGSEGPIIGATRAADSQGEWNLSIAMTDEVTPDNMGSAFANKENSHNLCYALRVNGSIVSDYVFEINTDKENKSADYVANWSTIYIGDQPVSGGKVEMPLGTSEVTVKDASAYDVYVSITSADQNDAEKIGVSVENNKITALPTAAGQTIRFDVVVLDVNGNEKKVGTTMAVTFGTTEAGEAVTLEEVPYVVSVDEAKATNKSIVVNLGETFSSLTATEAVALTGVNIALSDDSADKFVVAKTSVPSMRITYYSDSKCENEIQFADDKSNVKNIKYAKLSYSTIQPNAEAGTYTLVMTLNTKQGDSTGELKKVNIPVNVSTPTFESLFEKSAAWNGNTVSLALPNTNQADFTTAYKFDEALLDNLTVNLNKIDGKVAASYADGKITIDPNVVVEDGVAKDITGEAVYTFAGNLKVKSGDITIHFVAPLDGFALSYYTNGTAANSVSINGSSGDIAAYQAGNGNTKASGLAIEVKDKQYALGTDVNGVDVTGATFAFDAKAGNLAAATLNSGVLKITGLAEGTYSTVLTMTVKDANGIVNKATITINVKN